MNNYESDYDQNHRQRNDHEFHTRRSDRYRHPEQEQSSMAQQQHNRFEGYASPESNQHQNRSNFGNYDFRGDQMRGSGSRYDQDSYSSSRNYGNMGSYGGAQGFGSSRGGYSSQRRQDDDRNHSFDSGRGPSNRYSQENSNYSSGSEYGSNRDYGNQRQNRGGNQGWQNNDRSNQWGRNRDSSNQDLYGSDTSRRFQGSSQDQYDFDQDNYGSRSNQMQEGYYMGGRSNRVSRGDLGSSDGNYGSIRSDEEEDNQFKPYGLSGYYSGGYGSQDM